MLKPSDTPRIAILMGTPNEWGRKIVKGILSYANDAGFWDVWIRPVAPTQMDALPEGWQGDGVIGRIISSELADEISDRRLPAVNVADSSIGGFSAPCVRTDDHVSIQMAVNFFRERGFRNLACVSPSNLPNALWYVDEFSKQVGNTSFTGSTFVHSPEEKAGRETLARWLKEQPKPIGILAYAQGLGRLIIDACRDAGLSVPHDVAVLSGSYDELMCHAANPPLSGILLATEQIGYTAAELLHQMMLGGEVTPTTRFLPPLGIKEHGSTDTLAVEDPALVPLVDFLQKHAFESLSMSDILRIIPMSRRTLERRYFKAFGRTPFDEIRLIRINHARKLLVETDKPMQIIAEECGYTTYNYLAQVFKQVTGTSPSAYRKRMRVH